MRPSTALSAGAGLLLLAACSAKEAGSEAAQEEPLPCALAGAADFTEDCTAERSMSKGIATLIVRHPDGGFRRFDVLDNGRGIAVADGAQQAVTRFTSEYAEVAIGRDRYRLPITPDMIRNSVMASGSASDAAPH